MRSNNFKFRLPFILIAIAGLLIFLHFIGILNPLENVLFEFFTPVSKRAYSLGANLSNYLNPDPGKKSLMAENEKLKERIDVLTRENAELKLFKQESEVLKEELDFLKENFSENQFVTAQTISKSPDLTFNAIIINKGREEGLKEGLPVIYKGGYLVGKIIKTTDKTATVLLINDNRSKVASTILNEDKTMGLVEGEYGLSIKMQLIPQDELVSKNDLVITSGLEDKVPKGLIVGQVEKIIHKQGELFQTAVLSTLIDLPKLDIVTVILP